jgi:hypothetical protein
VKTRLDDATGVFHVGDAHGFGVNPSPRRGRAARAVPAGLSRRGCAGHLRAKPAATASWTTRTAISRS